MGDFLLSLSKNKTARKLVEGIGLPIPMPEPLRRAKGAWEERPLEGRVILIGAVAASALGTVIAETLTRAGASPRLDGALFSEAFRAPGEAYGRPALPFEREGKERLDAIVFDATGLATIGDLALLYEFFHGAVGRIARCGRVVVLARPPSGDAVEASIRASLDGFVRALGKEVGRKGATVNLLVVEPQAARHVPGPLAFLLSSRSAFVSGQPVHIGDLAAGAESGEWVRALERKVVLLTGAARGIGERTARVLAAEGAHVVCVDRPGDEAELGALAREISGTPLAVDVTDAAAPERLVRELKERFGHVDVVVHNAGITRDKTLGRMSKEQWDQVLGVNLAAIHTLTAALLPLVLGHGRIICLSSIAGIAGNMGQTNYATSKAGVIGFVRALAKETAERGVTVNAVAPGFIETRLTAAIPVPIREAGRRLCSLGQGGQPEDVAQLIAFLATPAAQGITGQVIRVCGQSLVGA